MRRPRQADALLAAAEIDRVVMLDAENLETFGRGYQLRTTLAELRFDILLPQIGRFENMTIRVDDVVFHDVHLAHWKSCLRASKHGPFLYYKFAFAPNGACWVCAFRARRGSWIQLVRSLGGT